MKKIFISAALFLFAGVACTALYLFGIPKKPFRNLEASQILSATVRLSPPDKTLLIPDTAELAAYLSDAVIYRQDNSYTEYCGQGVVFTLFMRDGTEKKIMAYNPFLVIDDVGYRTKYAPCQALSAYANRLLREGSSVVVMNEPPALDIISDETCFQTETGSYSWQRQNPDGTMTGTENDCAHPLECRDLLLPFETTDPAAVFRFSQEPDEILEVRCWSDAHWSDPLADSETAAFSDRQITLKPGGYIYEVKARWSTETGYGGTASYFFYILYDEDPDRQPDG